MKKVFVALCLMLGGVAVVNAQVQEDSTSTSTETQSTQPQPESQPADLSQDRQQIQVSELPEAVRTSLESTDYSGWNVSAAYRSTQTKSSDETQPMEIYIVELKNGAETKSIHFDKDGNKISDEEKKDDQK